MTDMVNSPPHYKADTGLEAISVIRAFFSDSYTLGTVFKYIARAGKKWDDLEDLKKARWYLDKEIQWREDSKPDTWEPKGFAPYGDKEPKIGDRVQMKATSHLDRVGYIASIRELDNQYPYEVSFGIRSLYFSKDELWIEGGDD